MVKRFWPGQTLSTLGIMNKSCLFVGLFFLLWPLANIFASDTLDAKLDIKGKIEKIVIDVRGSRGGKGDVAAGYLFAMDLMENYKLSNPIVFLAEDTERSILLDLANGVKGFDDNFSVKRLSDFTEDDVFDLCIQLANKTGDIRNREDFRFVRSGSLLKRRKPRKANLNIAEDGVVISQPVIGNTEDYFRSRGTLWYKGSRYALTTPGLEPGQSGVYRDFIALRLRDLNFADTLDFVQSSLDKAIFLYRHSEDNLKTATDLAKVQAIQIGLVYGISLNGPQRQFYDYLEVLLNEPRNKPLVIFSPSSFDLEKFAETKGAATKNLELVTTKEWLPKNLSTDKVYLVLTENLPHPTFIGLMAASMKNRFVTIGAGDGFMSAAINLGGPFAMTTVVWNVENVNAFGKVLYDLAERKLSTRLGMSTARKLFIDVFTGKKLAKAPALSRYEDLFKSLNEYLPDFAERILDSAYKIKQVDLTMANLEKPNQILDPLLDEALANRISRKTVLNKLIQFVFPKTKLSCVQSLRLQGI